MLPVRYGYLKAMGLSAAHCREAMLRDEAGDGEQTDAMERGSAVHAMVLGNKTVTTAPDDAPKKPTAAQRNAKKPSAATLEAIAWWDDFERDTAGAIVLPRGKYELCSRMADAIRANPIAADLLTAGGVVEETRRFSMNGRDCRTTPDIWHADFEAEIKTTVSADPQKFLWQSMRMGWHGQHAWHLLGCELSGHPCKRNAYTIAVEAARPHVVTVMRYDEKSLEMGLRCVTLWFERLRACERSNQWPGYAQMIIDISVPESDDVNLVFPDDESEAA